jgi:hypothetical protein
MNAQGFTCNISIQRTLSLTFSKAIEVTEAMVHVILDYYDSGDAREGKVAIVDTGNGILYDLEDDYEVAGWKLVDEADYTITEIESTFTKS